MTDTLRVARPASLPPSDHRLVVVEASAGTGKTYFLEHRVVDLILGAAADLGQILLVTFTDKAVAELRLRIRDVLDRLSRVEAATATEDEPHWQLDLLARRRLRAAVTAFDHAPIFTIHGFCHRVLVEDAFASHRLFEQTQVADEVAFDAAFGALLREQFARLSPDRELLAAFLTTHRDVDRLRDMLLVCARAGVDARVRRRLVPDDVRAVAAAFRTTFGTPTRRDVVAAALTSERRWLADRLVAVGDELDRCPVDAPAAQLLAMLDACRDTAQKIAARAAKLPADVVAAVRGVVAAVSLDEAVAAAMLPSIMARIQADKQERGQFDYDDMLQLVWRALSGPRGDELANRLRERMPWAMIDEFQDTDPVQWSIFRKVWMHPETRGLTIVGDPKQAIYGFRGADVRTYLEARDEMLRAGATRVPLDVNRRSTEPLVAAVNEILLGNPLMPLLSGEITYSEPVRASGDVVCDDVRPPVAVLALHGDGKTTADANRQALARGIGDAIEALRARPPSFATRGVNRPFQLGHVLVLTRTNRESTDIAGALRARGLPCALVEPEKLFATREAAELACVLAAIAAPRDRSARLRALRTRFFDVPWGDLVRVVDAPDHHPLIARIFDWAQLAGRRAYETLFRRVVEDSRYAERALVLGGGERAVTNTWHLLELLLAELARSRSDLHELVSRLRRWMMDDASHPDERDVQRAETDADAVRILTIHKAKGLEAPYVFLYGGISAIPRGSVQTLRDATGRLIIVGDHDDATRAQLDAALDADHQRLAYVALTRAQVRLYLPLFANLKKDATYQPIQRCLAPLVERTHAGSRVLFERIDVPVELPGLPDAPPDALATFVAPAPPAPAELAPLPATRGGLVMLSYTRLAHDVETAITAAKPGDALAIDPAEFDVDDASGTLDSAPLVGPTDLPPGAASGLLLHDVFEIADLALARGIDDAGMWAAEPQVAAQLADAARGRGVDPKYLPHAARVVHATLTRPLALSDGTRLPALVGAPAFAREVEFSYPLTSGRGLVRGFIDALVVHDDELWVLDYKSDVLAGSDLVRAAHDRVMSHYAVQARLYAIAADRLRGTRRLAGLLFAFVRHDLVVPVRLEDGTLASWQTWLAGIAARLDGEATS